MIVTIGTFTHKQESLRGEDREARQGAKAEQRQDEEEQAQTVLETLDVIGQSVEEIPRQDSQKDGNGIVGEHQHRIAIKVAPSSLRKNDELTAEADACIAHRLCCGGAIHEVRVTGAIGSLRRLNSGNNFFLHRPTDVRVGIAGDEDIKVSLARGRGRQVVRVIENLRRNVACLARQTEPLLVALGRIQSSILLIGLGSSRRLLVLPA